MALNNSKYNEIMRIYEKRQLENHDLRNIRIKEVYSKIPDMSLVEKDILNISGAIIKATVKGDKKNSSLMRKKLDSLRKTRDRLLLENGFSVDYMNLKYTCSDCKDTGYIGNNKCHCFIQQSINLLYEMSNLSQVLEKENFSTLSMKYYSKTELDERTGISVYEHMKNVIETCKKYTRTFKTKKGSILFSGSPGTGKSFLSNCIAKDLLDRGFSVCYISSDDLFNIFAKNTFSHEDEYGDSIYEYIMDCDLLIIDDLGTEVQNSFTNSKLFSCIQHRLSSQTGTIISTNLSPYDLGEIYSERVTSRIISTYTHLYLFGSDIRLSKSFNRHRT